ncbi:MAG: hypothetical protein ACTSUE_04395 [Promethearchaeota archaeon]
MPPERNPGKFAIPILISTVLVIVYYTLSYFFENSWVPVPEFVIFGLTFGGLDMLYAFFFGFFILGMLGIAFSKFQFPIHQFFRKKKKNLDVSYVMLNTGGKVSASTILKRAFLIYAVSISLTLSIIQLGEFLGIVEEANFSNLDAYIQDFNFLYTFLVFFLSFIVSMIITPTWFFDDINLMFYKLEEGMVFLYPYGRSILPWLKGYGGPSIIFSYILFIIPRIGIDMKFMVILADPVITLYIPIMFLVGFESISFLGKKILRNMLMKKNIEQYDNLDLVLTRGSPDVASKKDHSNYIEPESEP